MDSGMNSAVDSALTLWGIGSPRSMRAHWALHELSLCYVTRPIRSRGGTTQTPAYTALNPRQKIPLLQDGDFTIGESAAIVAYLSAAYAGPHNTLVPADHRGHAQWLEWCFFIAMELDAVGLYVMRRHGDLKHLYGDAPEVVAQAAAYFHKQLQHVERALADGRPYLCGADFSSADILLTTCLTWAVFYRLALPAPFGPYLRRIAARRGYQQGFEANLGPASGPNADTPPVARIGDWRVLLA